MRCPLCKQDADLSIDSALNTYEKSFDKRKWSLIEKKDIDLAEYMNDLDERLVNSLYKLVN
jgi:hypothetical protein